MTATMAALVFTLLGAAAVPGSSGTKALVTVHPPQLRLAQRRDADVEIRLEAPDGSPVSGVALEVLARAGNVSVPREVGPGRYAARYTAPEDKFPQADFLVVRSRQGILGWKPLPLVGAGKVEVETEPNALVKLLVAGKSFGPVRADNRGRALITFEAPPGVNTGKLVATDGKRSGSEREIDLGVPVIDPIMLVAERQRLIAGTKKPLWIDAYCVGEGGAPLAGPPPEFRASAGRLGAVRKLSDGWFRVEFFPPRSTGNGSVEVSASVVLQGRKLSARLVLGLSAGPPAEMVMRPEEKNMRIGGGGGRVRIDVLDENGNPADAEPIVDVECGTLRPPRKLAQGSWEVAVYPPSGGANCRRLVLTARVAGESGRWVEKKLSMKLSHHSPRVEPLRKNTRVVERVVEKPVPPPRSRLRPWAWAALGTGAAALVPGLVLIGIHGKETCDGPAEVRCPDVYDTRTGGAVLTAIGSAALIGGVVMHILAWREEKETPLAGLVPLPSGAMAGIYISF